MRYTVLATDFDGTLAHDGRVDESTVADLRRARDAGIRLVMVTGRELPDLFNTFAHSDLFDLVVAENGAVIYDPLTQKVDVLTGGPPPALVEILEKQSIPLSVGHAIVATVEPHEHQMLSAIRNLGLDWHVIFNKGAVMALPSDVTKATGLEPALTALGAAAEETVGIGDAENDQAFLKICGLAVAVDNALGPVKEMAHVVTRGARGAGVSELIERWLAGGLEDWRTERADAPRRGSGRGERESNHGAARE